MLKNLLFVIFLVVFMVSFSFSVSAQKEELMNKIYAYYPLDGNTIDKGPKQLNGEQISEIRSTEDRFGNKDRALSFNGQDESLKLPVNINPEIMPKLTIALWLKVDDFSGISTIISHNDGGVDRSIIIDGRKNRPLLSVAAGRNQQVYGGISIPLNKWIFTAASWNAETGKVSLYFADQNKNFSSISTNNINPKNGNDFITLAGNQVSGDFFQGSMDQLMIWDQILTMDQIKSLAY